MLIDIERLPYYPLCRRSVNTWEIYWLLHYELNVLRIAYCVAA